jgi:hypothetical protein
MTLIRFDRLELKYVIDAAQRRAVVAALAGHTEPDRHGNADGRYPVISQYYDNAAHGLFWERERGLPSRRKLRIRLYGGTGTSAPPVCFVEIKHNHEGRVAKRRARLPIAEAEQVCTGRPSTFPIPAEQERLIDEVRRFVAQRDLHPVLLLRYERQAFRGDDRWPDLRVTFDDHIAARGHDLHVRPGDRDFDVPLLAPGLTVLEIKVAQTAPRWLAEAVAAAGCLLQRHSKFSGAMSALNPDLPPQPRPIQPRLPASKVGKTSPTTPASRADAAAPVRSANAWTH